MNRWLLALAALAACGDKQPTYTKGMNMSPMDDHLPASIRQLVTGITDDWTSTNAKLQLWTREPGGPWTAVGSSWDAVIGHKGSAWGLGLRATSNEPVKREGDGKAPAGIFAVRTAYGHAAQATTKLPYTQIAAHECIDDASSAYYTRIVDRKWVSADWKSSEQMKSYNALYTWVIDLAHNPTAKPGAGSCIFFHVWDGPSSPTVGCTAMEEAKLVELLDKLDPAAQPAYVLLPRAEYEARQRPWDLPPP